MPPTPLPPDSAIIEALVLREEGRSVRVQYVIGAPVDPKPVGLVERLDKLLRWG